MSRGARRARLALVAAAVLALGACGRKGPPIAPELLAPQPVARVTAAEREQAVDLAWTNPTRRLNGVRLLGLAVARVFRYEDAGMGEPKTALLRGNQVVGYTEIAVIRLVPGSTFVSGNNVHYTDRQGLTLEHRYTYVVVTTDEDGRTSPPSPRVSVTFIAGPEPPRDLRAAPGNGEARLEWAPPAALVDGTPVTEPLVYEILRGLAPGPPLTVVGRTGEDETTYTDRGLANGTAYAYAVRAILTEAEGSAQSAATEPVNVTPEKTTPPAPPRDLAAIPSEGTVRLSWAPSPDADIARYIVYRADDGGPFTRIGSVVPPVTTFIDGGVGRGRHRYAVTAQDTSPRANESAHSNEVTVAVP